MNFTVVTWVMIAPLLVKIYLMYFDYLKMDLLRKSHAKTNPYHLMHRLVVYKDFIKNRSFINPKQKMHDMKHFYIIGKNIQIDYHTQEDGTRVPFNFATPEHYNYFAECFLRTCITFHPNIW